MTAKIPTKDLKRELIRLATVLEKTPTRCEMEKRGDYSGSVYTARFGSWNEALSAVDLTPNVNQSISESDLISDLQRVSDEIERTPTAAEIGDYSKYSIGPYKTHFGSWNGALEAAGLSVNHNRGIANSELIKHLQKVAEDFGKAPTREEMKREGDYSVSTYELRFGTWNGALEEASLSLNKISKIGEEDLRSELQRLADELGRTPSYPEMGELGKYDPTVYEDYFGTWNESLDAAGLSIRKRYNIEKSDLITAFQDLAAELGTRPSAKDMMKQGKYNWKAYRRAFGSWDEAVAAAGFEPYEAPVGEDHPRWIDGYESYYGPNWQEQRLKAVERDNSTCVIKRCDVTRKKYQQETGRDLHVHHVKRKESFRRKDGSLDYKAANDLSNLVTMCPAHHRQYEGIMLDTRDLIVSN